MKFRKKPVVIEARRFDSGCTDDQEVLARWCNGSLRGMSLPAMNRVIQIQTLEGEVEASFGDWIIKGVKGEFYPCKPDIFALTYSQVADEGDAGPIYTNVPDGWQLDTTANGVRVKAPNGRSATLTTALGLTHNDRVLFDFLQAILHTPVVVEEKG